MSEDWSPDHPSLAQLSPGSSALPSQATLAVFWAAQPYPDTFHQYLLHHLGQLASQPSYVTSTASAKPCLVSLAHVSTLSIGMLTHLANSS
ncbi:hypothetical protein C0995_000201 [Termitomyces sp. Mi166|nr:hypothetical protein C0995_000201 [Termitomyces sp. Mi166\